MFDWDKWREVWQTISCNKSRSLLTAFGIFWGVFMLVLLMGGARSMSGMLTKTFQGFAQNSLMVFATPKTKAYKGQQVGQKWSLNQNDLTRLRNSIHEIEHLEPCIVNFHANYQYKDRRTSGIIKAVRTGYQAIENPKVNQGRFLNDMDIEYYRKVCVLGKEVATNLFPRGESSLGKFVALDGLQFQVVGVSSVSGGIGVGGPTSTNVFIPFSTYQRLQARGTEIDIIAITARPRVSVSSIEPRVRQLLQRAHDIHPQDDRALSTLNAEAMFQMVQSLFDAINVLVWLIGIGTLLSGTIGVSNIMMVVVRERTVEIGIRRAIGAHPRHILSQILTESALLTLGAGLMGIVAATLCLAGAEFIVAQQSAGSVPSFQIGFGESLLAAALLSVLGTMAGIAPALRALRVKPIEAIRNE